MEAKQLWGKHQKQFFSSLPKNMLLFTKKRLFRLWIERTLAPGRNPTIESDIFVGNLVWEAKNQWDKKKIATSLRSIKAEVNKLGFKAKFIRIKQIFEIIFGSKELIAMNDVLSFQIGKGTRPVDGTIVGRIRELTDKGIWPAKIHRILLSEEMKVSLSAIKSHVRTYLYEKQGAALRAKSEL